MPARRPALHRPSRFMTPFAIGAVGAAGAFGLIGLFIALFGPRRFQREVIQPVQTALGNRAEKLWAESKRLRG